MSNFDSALAATEIAYNSMGSAAKENSRYMESIESKLNQFKAAFQELALTFINSDFVKQIIDLGTALLKFANTDLGQTIIKIAAFGVALKGLGAIVGKLGLIESFTKLGRAIKAAFTFTTIEQNFSNIYGVFGKANQSANTLYGTTTKVTRGFGALAKNAKVAIGAMSGLSKAGLIGAGVFALIQAAEYISGANERAIEGTKEKISELEGTLQATEDEFNTLSQKQVDLKKNGEDLTDIEKARLGVLNAQTEELNKQLKTERQKLKEKTIKGYSFTPKNANITDVHPSGVKGIQEAIKALEEEQRAYQNLEGAYNAARQAREGEVAITNEYVGFLQKTVEGLDDVANQYLLAIEMGDGLSATEQQLLQDIINQNVALEEAGGKSNILGNAYIYLANNQAAMIPYIQAATKGLEQEGGTYVYTSNAAKKAAQDVIRAEMEASKATIAQINNRIAARMAEAQSLGEFVKTSGVNMSIGQAMAIEAGKSTTKMGRELYKYYEFQKSLNAVKAIGVKASSYTGGGGGGRGGTGGGSGGGRGSASKAQKEENEKVKKQLEKLNDTYLESYQRRERIASSYYNKIQKKAYKAWKSGQIKYDTYKEYMKTAAKNIFDEINYRYDNGIYSANTYYKKITYFANKFYKKNQKFNKITYEEYREYIKKATEETINALEEQYEKGKISGQKYYDKVVALAKDAKKKKILSTKEYKEYVEKAYEKLFDSITNQYERGKISAKKYYNEILTKGKKALKAGAISADEYADKLKDAAEAMKDMAQTKLDAFEFFAEDKKRELDNRIELEQSRIDKLNEQLEAMDKQNDMLDKQAERMELINNLADAKKQKVRIFDERYGWVYVSNPQKVAEAQKALDEFDKERERDAAREKIEKEIASIEEVIKEYQEQQDAYDDLIAEQNRALERWEIQNKLGMTIEQAVLQGRLDNFENFKNNYIAAINEMIAALEMLANAQKLADQTYEEVKPPAAPQETATDKWNRNILDKVEKLQQSGKSVYLSKGEDGRLHYSQQSAKKANELKGSGGNSAVKIDSKTPIQYTTTTGKVVETKPKTTKKSTSKPKTKPKNKKGKASGSHSLPTDAMYRINELGDELLIPPTGNLAYLTKGTGVIPAHLTDNLMDLGRYNMSQWAKLIGNASAGNTTDSHDIIIQNMTVKSDNANDFVRQLQNLSILKK